MNRRILLATTAVVLSAALGFAQDPTRPDPKDPPDQKLTNPKLRAALHELREARKALTDAEDVWPTGYRDRALASTQEAIDSVRIILAVKDLDKFVGVERKEDYYAKYKDYPYLRAALDDLREARDELRADKEKVNEVRQKAIDDIEVAIGDILTLIRPKPKK